MFFFVESEVDKRGKMGTSPSRTRDGPWRWDVRTKRRFCTGWPGWLRRKESRSKSPQPGICWPRPGRIWENLEKEMEKLFSYTLGQTEITVQDVDEICTTQITNKIFDMVEAVAKKQQKRALHYYYDLLALKEPPMRILYLLSRQFKLLMEVKDLSGRGYEKSQIAKTAGLHPFVAGKYIKQCHASPKKN